MTLGLNSPRKKGNVRQRRYAHLWEETYSGIKPMKPDYSQNQPMTEEKLQEPIQEDRESHPQQLDMEEHGMPDEVMKYQEKQNINKKEDAYHESKRFVIDAQALLREAFLVSLQIAHHCEVYRGHGGHRSRELGPRTREREQQDLLQRYLTGDQ